MTILRKLSIWATWVYPVCLNGATLFVDWPVSCICISVCFVAHTHTAICAHPSLYTLLANCQHTLIFTYFSSIQRSCLLEKSLVRCDVGKLLVLHGLAMSVFASIWLVFSCLPSFLNLPKLLKSLFSFLSSLVAALVTGTSPMRRTGAGRILVRIPGLDRCQCCSGVVGIVLDDTVLSPRCVMLTCRMLQTSSFLSPVFQRYNLMILTCAKFSHQLHCIEL